MLSLFYQMTTKKKNGIAFGDHYKAVLENIGNLTEGNFLNKCRVCLREGSISLYSNDHKEATVEVLERYSDIILNKGDEYPKHLCTVCFNFIKVAILFRKTANRVDEILKEQLKDESRLFEPSVDINEYSDSSFNENDKKINSGNGEDKKPLKKTKRTENNREIKYGNSEDQEPYKKTKRTVNTKITCHICSKVISRSYYKVHITMHDPDQNKYVCDICGKSFRLRCAYYNHSLRHRTDFPYKCQFCPYRGRYSELLKMHMRTHTGDYRYMCTECPAQFLFKSNLNRHMLKHKDPKFKCEACKRTFHTKLTMQRHFEVDHLGIKNHVCGMCGKAFGYRNALMKHQRRVHKREKLLFGRMPSYLQMDSGDQK